MTATEWQRVRDGITGAWAVLVFALVAALCGLSGSGLIVLGIAWAVWEVLSPLTANWIDRRWDARKARRGR